MLIIAADLNVVQKILILKSIILFEYSLCKLKFSTGLHAQIAIPHNLHLYRQWLQWYRQLSYDFTINDVMEHHMRSLITP